MNKTKYLLTYLHIILEDDLEILLFDIVLTG